MSEQDYEEFADFTDQDLESEARDMGEDAQAEKIRENRLRRAAVRQGLRLEKSRVRDPRALTFGTYQLVDPATNTLVSYGGQNGYGLSLDEVEKQLTTGAPPRR